MRRLANVAPVLESMLTRGPHIPLVAASPRYAVPEITCTTVWMTMRDGVRLATDLYLPPACPAPVILTRTPYGRAADASVATFLSFARRGYAVVAQDCRGTGNSEPSNWDYYIYEVEDSYDCVEWVTRQEWSNGFLGACGGSYVAQTQWCMAMHPAMSTIVPLVGGLGIAHRTVRKHLFYDAYARTLNTGVSVHYTEMERAMISETLASGYFNEPLSEPVPETLLTRYPELRTLSLSSARRRLWEKYCELSCAQRAALIKEILETESITIQSIEALRPVFGHEIAHDAFGFPSPSATDRCKALHAPALMVTGWYDWSLHDPLATWELLRREARESVRSRSRFIITPAAHNMPGYHEGRDGHPELERSFGTPNMIELLLHWYEAVQNGATDTWPTVTYYLMGANQWCVADDWPPPEARTVPLFLRSSGGLGAERPGQHEPPDSYAYDPNDPTPTVGGSIVSFLYPPGSVDVADVQQRTDVLSYTTVVLEEDLDVVGPLRLILYVSSSAPDTDFSARLADVFPDGRAIQLQSGILRARYRDSEPQLLELGRVYRLEIDMWATANRFKAGHRLRLDISSADFPRFDRNTNTGSNSGPPTTAVQSIYHDEQFPSQFQVSVLSTRLFGRDLGEGRKTQEQGLQSV